MAWLVTKRECLNTRKCVIVLLVLLNSMILTLLFDHYKKRNTNPGMNQIGQMQMSQYLQNTHQKVGNKEEKNAPAAIRKIFQTQAFRSQIRHRGMEEIKDKTKQTENGLRSRSTAGVTDVFPLDDFIRYPCLEGLPLLSTNAAIANGNCVRTINFTAIEKLNVENCVPLTTPSGSTPMCTYPPGEDIQISQKVRNLGKWEPALVTRLARVLKSQTDLELLDIGCNLGVYTLTMAHQGTNVTAIDAVVENIKLLSKSVKLGNLDSRVTLIWNALSNEHKEVTLRKFKYKVGSTQIKDVIPSEVKTVDSLLTGTIMLDDLLPIFRGKRVVLKMDIEGSEYKALLGGKTFFKEIDVPFIQMEFILHRKEATGPLIYKYLSSYGFRPFKDIRGEHPLNPSDIPRWTHDVFFIKEAHT